MNILHICNGYVGSKVHTNLYRRLDELGISQTIFTCVYKQDEVGKNQFSSDNTRFVYANILRSFYRPFYHIKKRVITYFLERKVDVKAFDCIHATTLFTDGAQAYELHRKYGKPYIVAVRNTDMSSFLNRAPHTWALGKRILKEASAIVFISKAMMESFSRHKVIMPILEQIKDKFFLCPNGIDTFWLEHISHDERKGKNLLYVGDFSANKNVGRVINAVLELGNEPEYRDIHLTLVGGGKSVNSIKKNDAEQSILQEIELRPNKISFLGKIFDKDKLREVFADSDLFVMASIHETFGLVYVEALSQNLPVVYTKGQGIDGLFDSSVGEGVDPLSVESIKDAIRRILANPQSYSNASVDFSDFDWTNIAKRYIDLYQSLS